LAERERHLDAVFGALSNRTRRSIIDFLRSGESCLTDLARPFPISLRGVAKHVEVLEHTSMVATGLFAGPKHRRLLREAFHEARMWLNRV
jgi:predicted transcriptional regulator